MENTAVSQLHDDSELTLHAGYNLGREAASRICITLVGERQVTRHADGTAPPLWPIVPRVVISLTFRTG